jgi:hypothetical protein
MRKLTIFAIVGLLGTAISANASETGQRKHALPHKQHQTRQVQPAEPEPEKPAVTRLPVSPDTFRA